MRIGFGRLWTSRGVLDRRSYLLLGLTLGGTKMLLDWCVLSFVFHRPWTPLMYLRPLEGLPLPVPGGSPPAEFAALLGLAAPFFWVGTALSIQRLRAAALPVWLIVFFMAPVLHFALIALLVAAPTRPEAVEAADQVEGRRPTRVQRPSAKDYPLLAAIYSILVADGVALLLARLSVSVFKEYGWVLFLGLPFCLGLCAVLLYSVPARRTLKACLWVSFITGLIGAIALLGFDMEGIGCLVMALPIVAPSGMLGGWLGYLIQNDRWDRRRSLPIVLSLMMILPILMGGEKAIQPPAPVFSVTSSVEVNAPPEIVWAHVISFPDLPPPTEPVFQTGIAYPIRAHIVGEGPGAVRYCEFSTGSFVEPIRVWDEPRLLRFSVIQNPPPMKEWSLYERTDPPHLHGFLVSRRGQFLLTPLPGGRTLLQGTTWYQHHMWPAGYWRLWSDEIIHEIHLRVLREIKFLSEKDAAPGKA